MKPDKSILNQDLVDGERIVVKNPHGSVVHGPHIVESTLAQVMRIGEMIRGRGPWERGRNAIVGDVCGEDMIPKPIDPG